MISQKAHLLCLFVVSYNMLSLVSTLKGISVGPGLGLLSLTSKPLGLGLLSLTSKPRDNN